MQMRTLVEVSTYCALSLFRYTGCPEEVCFSDSMQSLVLTIYSKRDPSKSLRFSGIYITVNSLMFAGIY